MGVTQAPDQGTAFWFTLVQIERWSLTVIYY
jgi:hypothetical protein